MSRGYTVVAFGLWQEGGREAMVLQNPNRPIYRKLV